MVAGQQEPTQPGAGQHQEHKVHETGKPKTEQPEGQPKAEQLKGLPEGQPERQIEEEQLEEVNAQV